MTKGVWLCQWTTSAGVPGMTTRQNGEVLGESVNKSNSELVNAPGCR